MRTGCQINQSSNRFQMSCIGHALDIDGLFTKATLDHLDDNNTHHVTLKMVMSSRTGLWIGIDWMLDDLDEARKSKPPACRCK